MNIAEEEAVVIPVTYPVDCLAGLKALERN